MTTAKQVKVLVLDMTRVADLSEKSLNAMRVLVNDGWLYGFNDGSRLSEGEHDKMQAFINEVAKQVRRQRAA